MTRPRAASGGTWLLVLGVAAGAALAGHGVLGSPPRRGGVPEGAVALVEGVPVLRDDYERALAAVAADRRGGVVDARLRRQVLDKLIDEELLVQRGLELRLAERDGRVRGDLASAVIELLVAEAEPGPPPAPGDGRGGPGPVPGAPTGAAPAPAPALAASDAELRRFYAENPGWFARPPRLRLEHARFAGARAEERALAARARLVRGEALATAAADADPAHAPLPAGLLSPATIEQYLGPTATRTALALAVGDTSPPLRTPAGLELVRVVERTPEVTRPFEEVRELVSAEYARRAGDRRVRAFLDERRARADVRLAADAAGEGAP